MRCRCRFHDLIPEQRLDLSAVPRARGKTLALEDAYTAGFCGAYLPTDPGPAGRAARWYRDEFRDEAGKDRYRFEDASELTVGDGAEFGYVASKDTFEAYKRDQAADHERWLFEFQQNSGNCVGAAGVELFAGLLGSRAMDPACGEVMRYVAAMWAYMFRGSCGQGWYGSAHASVTKKYGYCFSTFYDLPELGQNFDFDGEQRTEDLTVKTWCRSQPDDFISYVKDQGWFFDADAIYEFSGGIDGLKAMVRAKGQLHHGSNYTSGSSKPDNVKRIGGHMQTMFGGDWSPKTLTFFNRQGVRFTDDDFPCVNHQTWGGGWSGAVSDQYWPEWWGPKPQGAWIVGAQKQLRYFSDGYVYLPKLKGITGDTPPPPPIATHPPITGTIQSDSNAPIRGIPTLTIPAGQPPGEYRYLIEPAPGFGKYRFTPKVF